MTETVPQRSATDRVVRVFVSSTFRDMRAERDELVKHIFPQLRKLCEQRGVTWTDVDLRWGITDKQVDEGKVLPICLAEINNCRPFFIGLLGERYGWVPERGAISDDLIAEQPWLAEHLDHSVTELEILHGVLNDPAMANRACFYFRDPAYVETVPAADRVDFVESDAAGREKLLALKDRIRQSGLALYEDYSNPQALAERVLGDLTTAINQEFPPGTEPDPLSAEAAEHEAFAVSRARVYVGRDEYFARLDDHAAGKGPPLVVLGESGSGKSALLANWALRYRSQKRDEPLLMHFIGASAYSADWVAMLRRIMGELRRRFDIDGEIPTEPDDLRAEFANWLHIASARGRVVLVLDALNQLEDRDQAPDLAWLPGAIPANVRLIVSTLPGRSMDALANRDWPTMTVELLTLDERRRFIADYLATYTRSLDEARTKRIASAPQSANPLYLQTLLDELRVVGAHERLSEQIDGYLAAQSVPQLYEQILTRYEADYQRDRPNLVRDAMRLIWSARRGLSETELLELLGGDDEPLPRAHWSLLHFAADRSLVTRSGLINFSHDYLREAVAGRYLPTDADRHGAHTRLVDYFAPRDLSSRKVDELPWQLARADLPERLKDCLVDLDMFRELKTDTKKYELLGYWLQLGDSYDKVTEYTRALDEYESASGAGPDLASRLNEVALFLRECAEYGGTEPLYRRALAISEASFGPDHPDVARGLNNLAELLSATNRHSEAEPLYRRALAIDEASFGPDHPNVAIGLNHVAKLLRATNRHSEAEPPYRRSLAIFEASFRPDHPNVATALSGLAGLLDDTNRHSEAETLYRRALAINEASFGPDHPDVATKLNNLSLLLHTTNRHSEAEPLYRRALAINEASFGPDHPNVAAGLNNLAGLLDATNRHSEAEPLYRRALAIDEASFGPDHPNVATGLNNLAGLLDATNRHSEAEPLVRRSLAINEASFGRDHPEVAAGLSSLAALLYTTNRHSEAEPLMRRALAIDEASFGPDHPNVARHLSSLAELLRATNRHSEAEPLMRRVLVIDEASFGPDHPNVARDLSSLAELLRATNRHSEAEPLMRRVLVIDEASFGPDHPNVARGLNNLAMLLSATNRHSEAEPLYRRSLAICEASFGPDHPDVATRLNNLAALLSDKDRHSEAEPLYRRALAISEASFGPDHPDVAIRLNNLAALLSDKNRHSEAEPLYRRALAINEASFGPDHPNVAAGLNNLAGLLDATNRHSEAEPLYRRALAIDEASFGPDHPNVATGLNNLAGLLDATNRHSEAEPLYRRALAIDEASFGPGHPKVAIRLNNLAVLLRATNRPSEAEPLYRRALAIDEASFGPDHPNVAIRLNNLAELLDAMNRHSEAEPLYRRALAINEASFGPDHPTVARGLSKLAALLDRKGEYTGAEVQFYKALEDAPDDMVVLGNCAFFLQNSWQDFPGAKDLYLRALQADPADGINHMNYAGLCMVMGAAREAEEHLREAWRLVAGEADRFAARTLFLRAALAETRRDNAALYLGQLKTVFGQGIQPMPSRNTTVREHLQQSLAAEQFALFDAIYAAINEPDGLVSLHTLPAWQAIQPRPLDEPWL